MDRNRAQRSDELYVPLQVPGGNDHARLFPLPFAGVFREHPMIGKDDQSRRAIKLETQPSIHSKNAERPKFYN